MIKRQITQELITLSKEYPVVTIIGPRQAGKTTLAKNAFSDYTYVNLELPDLRELATTDPNAFFHRFKRPVILDEIQRAPQLLSYIQAIVDMDNRVGDFILTGSNQLQLSESITQSLAGRTAILKLLPLSISELEGSGIVMQRDEYLSKGFLPRIYDKGQEPFRAYGNYLETYVERDLRRQINVKNLGQFKTFLKLLAGRVGQIVNLNSLSNDIGISSTTLSQWLSVLEASFVIFRLNPYFENFGKRLIKSSKLYFTEPGLTCFLLGIQSPSDVTRDPLIGGLFENMVIVEILKRRMNAGMPDNLYFFRDNHGNEVDVILEDKRRLIPVEIKSAMTFNKQMTKSIAYFQRITSKAQKGFVVYAGDMEYESDRYNLLHFRNASKIALPSG